MDDGDDDTQLTDAQVAVAVNNEFPNLDTDATDDFSGSFNNLTDVPANLDTDSTDDFDGEWTSLANRPAGLDDGDDDTQLTDAQVAVAVNNEFPNLDTDATDDFSGSFNNLTDVPANLDTDSTDDYNTGIAFDGTDITITDNGGDQTIDISSLAYDDTTVRSDINDNTAAIAAHGIADEDISATNEIQTLSLLGSDLSISGTGGNTITLPSASGTTGSVFFADTDGTQTENNSQFFWDNNNNRLGIGTASPTHKLQVNGQVRATSFANANGTAGSPAYRFNDDSNTGMYRADTDELGFSSAGTEAMRIDDSQNVGIGDFSLGTVDANLHVKSDTGVPLKIEPSTSTPTGTSGGQMFVSDDDGILYIYDGTRSKWLSIDRTMVGWGRNSNNTSNEYLRQFNGALSNQNGWRMIRNGTITAISAQSDINQTWTFEIRKNDSNTVITSITMNNVQGNHNNTLNIDINEGDFIQAFCNGTSVDYPETLIEIAWRK